jgi:hypothetical protein
LAARRPWKRCWRHEPNGPALPEAGAVLAAVKGAARRFATAFGRPARGSLLASGRDIL